MYGSQDAGEQITTDGHLGQLEGDSTGVADDPLAPILMSRVGGMAESSSVSSASIIVRLVCVPFSPKRNPAAWAAGFWESLWLDLVAMRR
jgi:hypothetical protein